MHHAGNSYSVCLRGVVVGLCCPLSVSEGLKNLTVRMLRQAAGLICAECAECAECDFTFSHLNHVGCCGTVLQRGSAGF